MGGKENKWIYALTRRNISWVQTCVRLDLFMLVRMRALLCDGSDKKREQTRKVGLALYLVLVSIRARAPARRRMRDVQYHCILDPNPFRLVLGRNKNYTRHQSL